MPFIMLCEQCRLGHAVIDLPASPNGEGHVCPFCRSVNPGYSCYRIDEDDYYTYVQSEAEARQGRHP